MIYYLDSSFVVASLVTDESGSGQSRAWLRANASQRIAISGWVATEVSSALSIKVRCKELSVEDRNAILSEWRSLCAASFENLPITPDQFERATGFADRHDLGLRAGDALHVAIAAANGCTLVTLDRVLASAAPLCGVPVAALAG